MKTLLSFAAAAAAMAVMAVSATAHDMAVKVGDLTIEQAWTRATPGQATTGGGFLTITNSGSEADRLVGATSARAGKTEIHEMSVKDGIMVMRPVDGPLEIPAGGTLELKPGSYHVMFMALPQPFKQGETIPTTLTFEKAGSVDVDLVVEKPGAKGMSMDHGAHEK